MMTVDAVGAISIMKAIETRYDGYLFRSRLEARWAVFFNELHIKYEYEKEGFELSNGQWYLPDFLLPNEELWVEIKPTRNYHTEDEDRLKAFNLAENSKRNVVIVYGSPSPNYGKPNIGLISK